MLLIIAWLILLALAWPLAILALGISAALWAVGIPFRIAGYVITKATDQLQDTMRSAGRDSAQTPRDPDAIRPRKAGSNLNGSQFGTKVLCLVRGHRL